MLRFTIPGEPAAQPRVRFARRGRFVSAYDPKQAKDWKATAQAYLAEAMKAQGWTFQTSGCLAVRIEAVFSRPVSTYSKRAPKPRELKGNGKDADNIAKIVLDACNGVAWRDDSMVSTLGVWKFIAAQGEPPCVVVAVDLVPAEIPEDQERLMRHREAA